MLRNVWRELKALVRVVVLMWMVYGVSLFLPIVAWGIIPREPQGLYGIVFAPFLHGNVPHLLNNSVLLLVFGVLYCLLEGKHLLRLFAFLAVVGGFGTWLIGGHGVHIGASGVVFGLWSHLIFLAWFKRKLKYALVSILIVAVYGSLIFGLAPWQKFISWESHLCGALAGILSARYLKT
ncbi:MAG: rhomboid family intramembrane serine protease [Oligoflexales bacterium]|nr:rhomboid family intramembrane serine protease [Oligoflexales bacterium]